MSLCVDGADLIPTLPPATLADLHFPKELAQHLERFRAHIHEAPHGWSIWFYRHLIRSAFLLVVEQEGCFTRDLYPCCARVAKHHPEQGQRLWLALEWALVGPPSPQEAIDLGTELTDWILAHAPSG